MNEYDVAEQAYKNGYAEGYKDGQQHGVIRCSECKRWNPHWLIGENKGRCIIFGKPIVTEHDHFCSCAERR